MTFDELLTSLTVERYTHVPQATTGTCLVGPTHQWAVHEAVHNLPEPGDDEMQSLGADAQVTVLYRRTA